MKVEDLMTQPVVACAVHDTLEYAASMMWDNDCGCLPVVATHGTDSLSGIITDRDICMAAMFAGKPLRELRVEDAMAKKLQTCHPGDSLANVAQRMQSARIRRLPVVDATGGLVGIISMADLALAAGRLQFAQHQDIPIAEVGITLAAICQPSRSRAGL